MVPSAPQIIRAGSVIPAGQATASISITAIEDAIKEGNETIVVTLKEGSYDQASPYTESVTLSVLDNETVVTIEATDSEASEEGLDPGAFTFTRTGSTTSDLTVFYSTGYSTSASAGSDFEELPGSIVIPAGQASATLTITPIDDDLAESTEYLYLSILSDAAYCVGGYYASVKIIDNEPVVTIVATDGQASEESADPGVFTVTRSGPTTHDLVVGYQVSSYYYYATAGSDYQTLPGTVTIPAGQASATITVTPIDDTLPENDETVYLIVANSNSYSRGTPYSASVTIVDNEPVLTIEATDPNAAEEGTGSGTFTVTRTGPTTEAQTVTYTITGTARGDEDYLGLTGTVTIAAGSSAATVDVVPYDDILKESSETVLLTLNAVDGFKLGTSKSAIVTIADNEPTVTVEATDSEASEAGTDSGTYVVTRSGGDLTVPLTVHFRLGGTASPGDDYTGLPAEGRGSVTIAAGESSVSLAATPIDDSEGESLEYAQFTLDRNTTYHMGSPSSASLSIKDNDPVVTISTSSARIGESLPNNGYGYGNGYGCFVVQRAGDTSSAMTVNYTVTGDATANVDYAALSGTLTIPYGASAAYIYVISVDDLILERRSVSRRNTRIGHGIPRRRRS